jgi:hypothetical protein
LQKGKKAISDFKKLNPPKLMLCDVMVHYIESGSLYTNEYGDISESFYSSFVTT